MTHTSNRFLTVGSLLRPEDLLNYKEQIRQAEDITYPFYNDFDGYKETETAAVKSVIEKQVEVDLPELTDGEYSKALWHTDFVWGLNRARRYIAEHGYFFRDKDSKESTYETRRDIGVDFVDAIDGKNHPFLDHFRRLAELSPDDATLKQCIPSPSHIYGENLVFGKLSGTYYEGKEEQFRQDLAQAYKDFLDEFKQVGGKIVQFDDCLWELFSDDDHPFIDDKEKFEALAQEFIDLNNEVIAFAHDLGLKVYTHNCRGNYDSRNMSDGTYESISHLFLKQLNYDRFYLEWDDERAGSLNALEAFSDRPDTEVVLGLLSSKTDHLDDEERVQSALKEATQYVAKDKLYLSHQCGFASCDNGNQLSHDQQWAKIKQGQKIALDFWGE